MKSLKENFAPILFATIVIALFSFPFWSHFTQESKIKTQDQRIDNIMVSGGDMLVGASTLFAQQASIQLNLEVLGTYASVSGNFSFSGEIMPDGSTCSNGQVLKRTGANDWDCSSDNSTPASNSLNFDEFQNPLVLDVNITTTSGSFNWDFGGTDLANIGSASFHRGFKVSNASGDNLFRVNGSGVVSAGTWNGTAITDAYVADAITVSGGTLGSNTLSSGITWTTTGTLTVGDNGDAVNFDTSTWDVSAGVFSGLAGLTSTGDFDLGGAELEVSNGTSFTFDTIGEVYFDTTDNQIQIASAAFNIPVVIPTKIKLWSATVASTSSEFLNGGRLPLPIQRNGFRIKEIFCGIAGGTSVVINIDRRSNGAPTETLTCVPGGTSDTDIATNNDYRSYTLPSASLEFGAVTGTLDDIDFLDFSVWGVEEPR